jgi:aryl-alcohol dehydrogenase-like predicted oxidoreductase
MTPEIVRQGVGRSFGRLAVERIDLMQFHWWRYSHPGYIDAMTEIAQIRSEGHFAHIGVTNFDTDHLRLLVKHGIPVVSNQVSFSLLDRRARWRMTEFCRASGVKLLAYGTLAGGFLSDYWVGRPSRSRSRTGASRSTSASSTRSAAGACCRRSSRRRSASPRSTRFGRQRRGALGARAGSGAAVIIGARLGASEHRADNLALFSFALDRKTGSASTMRWRRRASYPAIAATSTASRRFSPRQAT